MAMRDDKKKLIGDYLKAADRFIQASEYAEAMVEVKKALDLEPGNMYALAYNQRIKAAQEAIRKKADAARVKKIADQKHAPPQAAEAPAPEAETPAPSVPTVPADVAGEAERPTPAQNQEQIERFKEEIEALRIKHQQEIAVLADELTQSRALASEAETKYKALVDDAEESQRRVEELYTEVVRLNELLKAAPPQPAPVETPAAPEPERTVVSLAASVTREELLRAVVRQLLLADTLSAEANDVMELIRTMLAFDDDEFVQLQTAVKVDIYRTALDQAWTEGYITPEQAEKLTELRKKIGVSAESHFEIEAELRKAKKNR